MNAPLYNLEILRLAASVAEHGRLEHPEVTVEKRSPTCGSRVTIDVMMENDRVVAFGHEVRACALGQAGAALVARHIVGQDSVRIATATAELRAYLAGERDDPGSWPGLEIFGPARVHRARHASILLAFDAATEATARP